MPSNSQDETQLIHFLKQHSPPAAIATPELEDLLISKIQKQPQLQKIKPRPWLALAWGTSLVASAGLLLLWVVNPGPGSLRTAQEPLSSEELEAFLLETWSVTTENSSPAVPALAESSGVVGDWLVLAEPLDR